MRPDTVRRDEDGNAICACPREFLMGLDGDWGAPDLAYFYDSLDGDRHTYQSCGPSPTEKPTKIESGAAPREEKRDADS